MNTRHPSHLSFAIPRIIQRRGNSMVLVAALLVLLVIIATAFIARTQTGRKTGSAIEEASMRRASVEPIANAIADHISLALFPWPVDTANATAGNLIDLRDGTLPRFRPFADAKRYGVDIQDIGASTFTFPWNFAPHQVVPWTNPPDEIAAINEPLGIWPLGLGAPDGDPGIVAGDGGNVPLAFGNPLGDPGFGDTRWLRELEPPRFDPYTPPAAYTPTDTFASRREVFDQWTHLSYIGTSSNGYRIVSDISDVENNVVQNLRLPVEQWLPFVPRFITASSTDGDPYVTVDTYNNFQNWFTNYGNNYKTASAAPPNRYRLSNLGDFGFADRPNEDGERPEDEFIRGTARWEISRLLHDSDGDGFTDSFWWLSPNVLPDGSRQVFCISIIDNNAMINLQTATRFVPGTDLFNDVPLFDATAGETPADIALVGAGFGPNTPYPFNGGGFNVGFFDTPRNRDNTREAILNLGPNSPVIFPKGTVSYNFSNWDDYILSLLPTGNPSGGPADELYLRAIERRQVWNLYTSRPDDPSSDRPFSPYLTADEAELRYYYGSNYPWLVTRLERAISVPGDFASNPGGQAIRSSVDFAETSEYLDQLSNPELVADSRHRVTVMNGVRNDLVPAWLRWRWSITDPMNPGGLPREIRRLLIGVPPAEQDAIIDRFLTSFDFKADLRERNPLDIDNTLPQRIGFRKLHERLPYVILNALSDGTDLEGETYFGAHTSATDSVVMKMRELATAYAANILSRRDNDWEESTIDPTLEVPKYNDIAPLYSDDDPAVVNATGQIGALPLVQFGGQQSDRARRYLGLELQPFLVEAFVSHVHASKRLPVGVDGFPGNYVDETAENTTIVVVQIANPFHRTIPVEELRKYRLRVFNRAIDFNSIPNLRPLEPATEEEPSTAIFYLIPETFEHDLLGTINDFRARWVDFLDLEYFEDDNPLIRLHPDTTDFYPVNTPLGASVWADDRDGYDRDGANVGGVPSYGNGGTARAIELIRVDRSAPVGSTVAPQQLVVVDRFDPENTQGESVGDHIQRRFPDNRPPEEDRGTTSGSSTGTTGGVVFQAGIRIGNRDTYVNWARVTRAWGYDFNSGWAPNGLTEMCDDNRGIQDSERAPRFVIARQEFNFGREFYQDDANEFPAERYQGDAFSLNDAPDPVLTETNPEAINEALAWFTASYRNAYGDQVVRKPTHFEGHRVGDVGDGIGAADFYPREFSYIDKGFYDNDDDIIQSNLDLMDCFLDDVESTSFRASFQMLHRDDDYVQIGELLNTFIFGHELRFTDNGNNDLTDDPYDRTEKTFSEFLFDAEDARFVNGDAIDMAPGDPGETRMDARLNRLRLGGRVGANLTLPVSNYFDPDHAVPVQFAGERILDAFVCDGPGFNWIPPSAGGTVPYEDVAFNNAMGFSGRATPGMLNVNGAPKENLAALPQWHSLIHFDADSATASANSPVLSGDEFPRSGIPDSIIAARERHDSFFRDMSPYISTGRFGGPNYTQNGPANVNGGGFPSIGSLRSLTNPGFDVNDPTLPEYTFFGNEPDSYRIDFAAREPFDRFALTLTEPRTNAHLGTDVSFPRGFGEDPIRGDYVSGDVEEMNLLLSGASNLITTRSDMFTVYLKVRTFRQRESDGIWDATDPNQIVEDARYVMLVDRSEVNSPDDQPRIVYFERVPE